MELFYVTRGGSNFRACGRNPEVWLFLWKFVKRSLLWCYWLHRLVSTRQFLFLLVNFARRTQYLIYSTDLKLSLNWKGVFISTQRIFIFGKVVLLAALNTFNINSYITLNLATFEASAAPVAWRSWSLLSRQLTVTAARGVQRLSLNMAEWPALWLIAQQNCNQSTWNFSSTEFRIVYAQWTWYLFRHLLTELNLTMTVELYSMCT